MGIACHEDTVANALGHAGKIQLAVDNKNLVFY